MREQENLFGLCDDELEQVIKDYVFEQLPATETNSGLIVEVDWLRVTPKQEDGSFDEALARVGYAFPIATVTDKFLRFHKLDSDITLSKAGFRYYDKAIEEGRISQRGYDTALDRYGWRYFHIPNEIGVHQVPLDEVVATVIDVNKVDRDSASIAWHGRQLKISHRVYLEITATNEKIEVSSYFRGILELFKKLRESKN